MGFIGKFFVSLIPSIPPAAPGVIGGGVAGIGGRGGGVQGREGAGMGPFAGAMAQSAPPSEEAIETLMVSENVCFHMYSKSQLKCLRTILLQISFGSHCNNCLLS